VDALKVVIAAMALLTAAPVHARPVDRWRPLIAEASARFGVPVAWIERVMRAESGGFTKLAGRPITSRAGAMGLMQLMPATWDAMRARLGLGSDPYDPRDNILAGTLYLRLMYNRFGYPGLFAAYNAGPARYAGYVAHGQPLPDETRRYLAFVTGASIPVVAGRTAQSDALFFIRPLETAAIDAMPSVGTLFVPLGTPGDIVDKERPATSR
jgi:soluble lytic murein transglycosylase-like protein